MGDEQTQAVLNGFMASLDRSIIVGVHPIDDNSKLSVIAYRLCTAEEFSSEKKNIQVSLSSAFNNVNFEREPDSDINQVIRGTSHKAGIIVFMGENEYVEQKLYSAADEIAQSSLNAVCGVPEVSGEAQEGK